MEPCCSSERLWRIGFALVLAGFAVALVAALLPLLAAPGAAAGVGGCVILLFIPICFGAGASPLPLLIVAIVLAILLTLVSFVVWRLFSKAS